MNEEAVERRVLWIRNRVLRHLGRRGAVVQTSGGIDSAVTLFLCVRALGARNVTSLFLPDSSTAPETVGYAAGVAEAAGTRFVNRSITQAIEAQEPLAAIQEIVCRYFPSFNPEADAYSVDVSTDLSRRLGTQVYELSIGAIHGNARAKQRLSADDLRRIIAYQNRKQRTRMLFAYAEAEANNLAVVGASNGDELRTGFVVKYGDDAADICAVGDLPKVEVYALASLLGVPQEVIERPPTTDTFALAQGQDDYYYALPAPVIEALLRAADSDPDLIQRIAEDNPGWSAAALWQLRGTFAATVRYNTSRSSLFADQGVSIE